MTREEAFASARRTRMLSSTAVGGSSCRSPRWSSLAVLRFAPLRRSAVVVTLEPGDSEQLIPVGRVHCRRYAFVDCWSSVSWLCQSLSI